MHIWTLKICFRFPVDAERKKRVDCTNASQSLGFRQASSCLLTDVSDHFYGKNIDRTGPQVWGLQLTLWQGFQWGLEILESAWLWTYLFEGLDSAQSLIEGLEKPWKWSHLLVMLFFSFKIHLKCLFHSLTTPFTVYNTVTQRYVLCRLTSTTVSILSCVLL